MTLFQAAKSDIDPASFVECFRPCRRCCRSSQRSCPWCCRPKRRRRLQTSSLPFWTMRDAPSAKLPLLVSVTRCVLRVSLLLDPRIEACPKLRCNSLSLFSRTVLTTHPHSTSPIHHNSEQGRCHIPRSLRSVSFLRTPIASLVGWFMFLITPSRRHHLCSLRYRHTCRKGGFQGRITTSRASAGRLCIRAGLDGAPSSKRW